MCKPNPNEAHFEEGYKKYKMVFPNLLPGDPYSPKTIAGFVIFRNDNAGRNIEIRHSLEQRKHR